jgi:hypothetical protein
MSRAPGLSSWTECLSTNMPHLTKPQATVLALWSYGIACTRACGRGTVATFLALLLDVKLATLDQRLYEWCAEAAHKAGSKRTTLDVDASFVPLLRWVVRLWSSTQLALALDATSLRATFTLLTVSVVYRGSAIPVAWTVLRGHEPGSWQPHWERMLAQLQPAIPSTWVVLVLADRGLYARWLYRAIVACGWHPFLRINQAAKFRPAGQRDCIWLRELVSTVGQRWRGAGTAFSSDDRRVHGTLVAWWGADYAEPWFILTDLAPEGCDAVWYGLRAWCEQGFKCTKRGAWQWQQTQVRDPDRAARMWLALAVASLWMVSVGSDVELGPQGPQDTLPDLRGVLGMGQRARPRRTRLLRLGWLWVLVRLLHGQPIPLPRRLEPEPWPAVPERVDGSFTHHKALSYAFM